MSLSQDMMEDAFSPAKGIEAVYVRNLSDYSLPWLQTKADRTTVSKQI